MFRLFKKRNKNTISTEHMTDDEYIAAIEHELLPYWDDPVLCEKIGIKSSFEPGACVRKDITLEEAIECHARVCRILNIGSYLTKELGERSRKIRDDANATNMDKINFYSATTLKNLLIEAKANIELKVSEENETREKIVVHINAVLKTLPEIKHVVIEFFILMATLDKKHMIR